MTALTSTILIVFCIGYFFIAIESVTKINKAAVALLMLVATWTLFMLNPAGYLPAAIGDQTASVVSEVNLCHTLLSDGCDDYSRTCGSEWRL